MDKQPHKRIPLLSQVASIEKKNKTKQKQKQKQKQKNKNKNKQKKNKQKTNKQTNKQTKNRQTLLPFTNGTFATNLFQCVMLRSTWPRPKSPIIPEVQTLINDYTIHYY